MAATQETIDAVCDIAKCLHVRCEKPAPTETPEALGADSLELVQFMMELEERFDIEIKDEGHPDMRGTFAEWAMHVEQLREGRE